MVRSTPSYSQGPAVTHLGLSRQFLHPPQSLLRLALQAPQRLERWALRAIAAELVWIIFCDIA
jgi:hypothetical protein